MSKAIRSSNSFTVARSMLEYLQRTRSSRSRSERVNELLRKAILEEQNEGLAREAEEFFVATGKTESAEPFPRPGSGRSRGTVNDGAQSTHGMVSTARPGVLYY
jgi:hypothetical protein